MDINYHMRVVCVMLICGCFTQLGGMQPKLSGIRQTRIRRFPLICPVSQKCNRGSAFASRGAFLKHIFLTENVCGECYRDCRSFYKFESRRELIKHCKGKRSDQEEHHILRYCDVCFDSSCDDKKVYVTITPGQLLQHQSNSCKFKDKLIETDSLKNNTLDMLDKKDFSSDEFEIKKMTSQLDSEVKSAILKNIELFEKEGSLPYQCCQCLDLFPIENLAQEHIEQGREMGCSTYSCIWG